MEGHHLPTFWMVQVVSLSILGSIFHAMKEDIEKNQVGPCGIVCISCPLGSGTVAKTAGQTRGFIEGYKISEWAPYVSMDGERIDWDQVVRGMEWMMKYAVCAGCESGGGPPDCTIRICAKENGVELCSSCDELSSCDKFDWLGEHGEQLRETLKNCRGASKEEYIKSLEGSMPLEE